MSVKKFAISVPEDVMSAVDAAARRRGLTRSGFISGVLRRVATARRDAEVTRRINELFAGDTLAEETRQSADGLLAGRAAEGWEW